MLVNLIAIAVGIALVAYRREFARRTIAAQKRIWGLQFGERE